jgi:ATP-binding cassette subfamily B protein
MIRRLLFFANPPTRRLLRQVLVCATLSAVLQGLAFVLLVPFLTAVLSGDVQGTKLWLGLLAGTGLTYSVIAWITNIIGTNAGSLTVKSLLDTMGDRLVNLPIGWFSVDRSGELSDTASRGVVFASAAPYAILRPLITGFVTPATVLVGALFIDWRIGLVMAATVPLMWLTYRGISRKIGQADREHAQDVAKASHRVIEFARSQPALRAAGNNSIAQQLVAGALQAQHRSGRRFHLTGGAAVGMFSAVVYLAVIAVIVVGSWLAVAGDLTMPQAVPLLILAVRFADPIVNSGAMGGGMAVARNTLDRIQRLVDEPTLPEPPVPAKLPDPQSSKGYTVRFDQVTFAYAGGSPVLRDLSFEAPAGAVTAIVGPSGSGKTTITRLVARFYDPAQGTVSIGGIPLPELGSLAVTSVVAPVFQDVYLFEGTILDNIWLGRPEASPEEVVAAGRRARVDEIADRLPSGWETPVGEGGARLSGGERQRVSIARALLKNAPIVLLDEATSALDIDNEQAIQEAFEAVQQGRTVIIVAHRLSTIAAADQIIMLDQAGAVVERGNHSELLAAKGHYARYWAERVNATGWQLASSSRTTFTRPLTTA